MDRRQLGSTSLTVTPVGIGTSPLGSMPETYGHEVDQDRAGATLDSVLTSPLNLVDTSRNYGEGRSESRIGQALRRHRPDDLVLSTKLDREPSTGRFDAGRARRSFEESLEALGVDRVQILHLHDPEHAADVDEVSGPGGSIEELFRMRDEGLTDCVGLAMGRLDLMEALYERFDFDVVLNHNRFTLLNRAADGFYSRAHDRGTAILNAAPYAGGVLAKGADQVRQITYQTADDEALAPVRRLEELCEAYSIALGAAALQFSIRDPRICSTIVGVSKPERVAQTVEWATTTIPEGFWDEVAELPYDTDDPEAGRDWVPG